MQYSKFVFVRYVAKCLWGAAVNVLVATYFLVYERSLTTLNSTVFNFCLSINFCNSPNFISHHYMSDDEPTRSELHDKEEQRKITSMEHKNTFYVSPVEHILS